MGSRADSETVSSAVELEYILSLLVYIGRNGRNTTIELRKLRDIGIMCYQNDIEAVYRLTRDRFYALALLSLSLSPSSFRAQ